MASVRERMATEVIYRGLDPDKVVEHVATNWPDADIEDWNEAQINNMLDAFERNNLDERQSEL
jgi:hypothetical protein